MIAADTHQSRSARFNLHESSCPGWSSRAETAVHLWSEYLATTPRGVPKDWEIADIGCGDEKLRNPLSRTGVSFRYTGYDKLPQSPTCQPLDLAHKIPNRAYDLAFCLGVLEYLVDVPDILAKLRTISSRVVISYVPADSRAYAPDDIAAKGWLHHFTIAELESMFARAGFAIKQRARIDEGRTAIWLLVSNDSTVSVGDYAMLTPYPIPDELKGMKVANLGDGFIERAILDQLQPHTCRAAFSARLPLTNDAIDRINETKLLVLVGANQLNDNFTIAPGMTTDQFARIRVPVLPVGMGIHGIPSFTQRMSAQTQTFLRLLHERIRYSSWRCPRSVDYLLRYCPELREQTLMTGCPVIFNAPLLYGDIFSTSADRIVVTVTERHDFWTRETRTLDFVSRQFPKANKTLSLHQVHSPTAEDNMPLSWWQRLTGSGPKTAGRLSEYARRRGFEVFTPASVAECQTFYDGCDLHFGSRLHAHLYFLSRAKRSFLSYVDDRSAGMAQATGFPLCEPAGWQRHLDYDFEQYRTAARRCHQAMARFNWSVKELLT